jgi:DNA-binding LacI/PurR family transcriptional regulator
MSIREVAARAGVSPATVSRVFTQPQAVAAGTRRRVMTAAEELRYAPHPAASSLARGRTGNLGIVVPDISNPFSALVTKAVDRQARRDGYALFVAGSDEVVHDEEASVRALAQQVDGLLLVSPRMPDAALLALADMTPIVMLNRLLDGVPTVLTNLYAATGHAVEHLYALGHRTVVYLAGPDGYPNDVRLRGFRDACSRLGVQGSELGPFAARFQDGVRAADLILATSETAAVAYNDEIAVGVVNRLADRGIAVPGDVSVVGFDDTQLAEMVTPRLTTVRIPAAVAGTAAIEMLLDLVRGREAGLRSPLEVSGELVVRSSTGPVRTLPDPDQESAP